MNKELEKTWRQDQHAALHDEGGRRDAEEVPRVQRQPGRRRAGAEELLAHRLRGRHAQRPDGAGDPRLRQEDDARDRQGDGRAGQAGARRQAQARPDAGRHLHDQLAGRHRRHLLHAHHQCARGGHHGRVQELLEAAFQRRQDLGMATDAATVAVVGPPRHRRCGRRALQRALRQPARRHAARACSKRPQPWHNSSK